MESLRAEPESLPIAEGYIGNSQQNFKADQLRINMLWHEVKGIGEEYGLQSSQYLKGVLSVLGEELAYFSFIAGVYHCGAGGHYPAGNTIDQLNNKIQESSLKIERVKYRLENTADDDSLASGTEVAAELIRSRFLPTGFRLGARRHLATEMADIQARCEEIDWEYGSAFFNKSCVGIIDGYHEDRIEGLEQAETTKTRLEKKRRSLAKKIDQGSVA